MTLHGDEARPAFTCPVCGRASWNPHDAEHGWCGNCHGYTAEPPPPGMRWVVFHGEDGSLLGRLLEERWLEPGSRYDLGVAGGVYVYDGDAFVEVES